MKRLLILSCILSVATGTLHAQGSESFSNMPVTSPSNYQTRSWTGDNSISWTATDTRGDQTITGVAAGVRAGVITSGNIPNGIGQLTFKYKYLFTTGGDGSLNVKINGASVGILPVPSTQTAVATATFSNINVSGTFTLSIAQTVSGGPRVAIDDISWTGYSISCAAPTQAAAVSIPAGSITTSAMTINWTTGGAGTNSFVVMKALSPVTGTPSPSEPYTASATFGAGSILNADEYLVYDGSGNSVTVSNLASGSAYYVAVFSYDPAGPCYNIISPATGSATTVCAEPTQQVSTISPTPGANTASILWSGGNGLSTLVKLNTTNSFIAPVDGNVYSASSTYSGGEQVVYNGTGNTLTVTGLTLGVTYYVTAYTFNPCSGTYDYLTSGALIRSFTTANVTGIPAGYYDAAAGLRCAALKTALRDIVNAGFVHRSYNDLWDEYKIADIQPSEFGGGNVIWDIYSDDPTGPDPYEFIPGTNQCGTYSGEGDCYNREHSFPKSWFGGSTSAGPGSDYHHIFPTDGKVNGMRSNYPYGPVGSASYESDNGSKLGSSSWPGLSGTVFEPINEYKGDVARAFLYMVTCYQNSMSAWQHDDPSGDLTMDGTTYPSVESSYLQLMMKWANDDPPSQKEIDRNNAAYTYQGNRNPFVDHPEYVNYIWATNCATLPVELSTITARYQSDRVKLIWNIASAEQFSRFEIERSTDGRNFTRTGVVYWTTNINDYSFDDDVTNLEGNLYYRLKLVDQVGTFKYSKVLRVVVPGKEDLNALYPNPVQNELTIQFRKTTATSYSVRVADIAGHIVLTANFAAGQSVYQLPVRALPAGTYIIEMQSETQVLHQRFVKQ